MFPELRRGRDETYRKCELMTLTFDLEGHRDYRSYASWYFVRVPSANFGDTTTFHFRFMGHWANTAETSHDLATLTFDLGCRDIRIPSLKFVGLAIRKIWRTMSALIGLVTLI